MHKSSLPTALFKVCPYLIFSPYRMSGLCWWLYMVPSDIQHPHLLFRSFSGQKGLLFLGRFPCMGWVDEDFGGTWWETWEMMGLGYDRWGGHGSLAISALDASERGWVWEDWREGPAVGLGGRWVNGWIGGLTLS